MVRGCFSVFSITSDYFDNKTGKKFIHTAINKHIIIIHQSAFGVLHKLLFLITRSDRPLFWVEHAEFLLLLLYHFLEKN